MAEDAGSAPVVVVGALQVRAHLAMAAEVQFMLDFVAGVEDDGIACVLAAVFVAVVGFLLFCRVAAERAIAAVWRSSTAVVHRIGERIVVGGAVAVSR